MNVAHLRVLIDGSAAGALKALAAARVATKSTAKVMSKSLMPALKGLAAGFAVLGSQAAAGGLVALTNALAPLVGLVGLLPGALLGAAAAAGTLKLALSGVSDGMKILSATSDAQLKDAQAALDKLAPSARAFVLALKDIQPAFNQMHLDVQESLFAGMADTVKRLAGTYLPLLSTAAVAIAASMRRVVEELRDFALTAATVKDVGGILDNIRKGFANLGGAAVPLASIFRDIAAVSASFLPGMASGVVGVTEKLRDMTAAGRASGGIAEFIQGGIDAAKELGGVLGNVGGIIHAVMSAGPGAGLLTGLTAITQGIEDAVKSVEGQDALRQFFASAAAAGKTLGPVITALLPALSNVAAVLATLATHAAGGVVTAIKAISDGIGTLGPAAGVLGDAVGSVLTNLAGAIPAVASLLSALVKAAAPVLVVLSQIVSGLVQALAPAFEAVLPALSTALVSIGQALLSVMPSITPALQMLAGAIAQLLPPIAQLVGQLITGLVPVFAQLITDVVPLLMPALLSLVPAMSALIDSVVRVATALAPLIVQLVEELVPVIVDLAPDIAQLATVFGDLLVSAAPVIGQLISFAGFILRSLVPVIHVLTDALSFAAYGWEQIFAAAGPVLSWLGRVGVGAINGIGKAIGDLAWHIWNLPTTIQNALGNAGTWLRDAGRDIVNGLVEGIVNMASAPVEALKNLGSSMLEGFKGIFDIHSPSRVMGDMGGYLMAGLAGGITGGLPMVGASWADVRDLTTLASPDFTVASMGAGSFGMGASASSAGTVIQVNVTIPAGTTASDASVIDSTVKAAAKAAVGELLGGGVLALRQARS